mmetsp:Transcript_10074/g.8868  ORF Transcript_10074/g.8868 Transcript_10074/m.8868 type:complete len:118 (+) Transcript_10074:200-553(+)
MRRKTNPDNDRLYKFTFSSRKKIVPKFSTKCETPKATNCSSRLSSQNESKKENMGINSKLIYNSTKMGLSPNLKQSNKLIDSRKNSTNAKKMHKILLSPTNRTLLKPRKTSKKPLFK